MELRLTSQFSPSRAALAGVLREVAKALETTPCQTGSAGWKGDHTYLTWQLHDDRGGKPVDEARDRKAWIATEPCGCVSGWARAGAPDIEEIKARWRASGRTPSLIDDRDEYALTNCPTHKESA